jgi:lipopolysaccharide transport system ATP-binding protein
VLIIDEALSVGDIFFQQKCFNHIRQLQKRGVTILYVSHDLTSVQNICDQAILMKDGAAIFNGDPNEAVSRYYSVLGQQIGAKPTLAPNVQTEKIMGKDLDANEILRHSILHESGARHGARGLELIAARVCNDQDEDTLAVEMMRALRFYMLIKAHQPVAAPKVGFHLYDRLGNLVFGIGTHQLGYDLPTLDTDECVAVCLRIELRVQPGEFTFNLVVGEPGAGENPNIGITHDCFELLGPIAILDQANTLMPFYGMAQLPATVQCDFKGKM